jgi:hypothetical protein
MTERSRCFVRSPLPAGLVLTPRDAEVILACWEYRWLTRGQLQQLVSLPGIGRSNDRLRRLYDHGYLDRIRAATVGTGLQPVYLAGKASLPLLAERSERPLREVRERLREDARASAVLLPHDLQVNDVRIALVGAARGLNGAELVRWLHAADCYDRYAPGRSLRPDGYFQLVHQGRLHACFLEVDRGTSDLRRWSDRVGRYLEYRDTGAYRERYGLERFRVLTAAATPGRLRSLAETTRERTDRGFWFALTEEVTAGDPLTRPLWQPVGDRERRALLEPSGGG